MKKMVKKSVIDLLKNRQITYKELSTITGYHEKSLIRMNNEIRKGVINITHGNKNRKPANYIDNKIKKDIIFKYQSGVYKNYKSFYENLYKEKYSYSFICNILSKNIPKIKTVKKTKGNIIAVKRILIADNIIQYKNIRYKVLNADLKHHTIVILNIDNLSNKIYVVHNNINYEISEIKQIDSKTGSTKYN